jgi:hypothetical protein
LFKTGISASVFKSFISNYSSIQKKTSFETPFVYVDHHGVKLVAQMAILDDVDQGLGVVSMCEDGWMELVNLGE